MIGLVLTFLRYAWPFIVGGLIFWYADDHWCNGACKSVKADMVEVTLDLAEANNKLDVLDKARIEQQERWAQATAAQEKREKEQDEKRKQVFAGLKDRARSSTGPDLRFGLGSDRLFRDIANAANAEAPSTTPIGNGAGEVPGPAEAEVYDQAEFKGWLADVAAAFDKLNGQKQSCIQRYNDL